MSNPLPVQCPSAKVAVVGAGITGYTAVAALAQSGFTDITVIESQNDVTIHEPNRAYTQIIDQGGVRILRQLTDFQPIFAEESYCQNVRVVARVSPDGKSKHMSSKPPDGPRYWVLKCRLLQLLDSYIKERYPKVVFKMDTTVDEIVIPPKGTSIKDSAVRTKLMLRNKSGEKSEQEFDLLIACDGSESTMQKEAIRLDTCIRSSHGMSLYSKNIPSTGIRTKGILLSARPLVSAIGQEKRFAETSTVYQFIGERSKRAANTAFDVLLLPVGSSTDVRRRATIGVPEGHKLLSITNGEDMLALFRENFPNLAVDDMFPREEMEVFAKTKASTLPAVRRPNSLVGFFPNTTHESAVMFMGDSAHTFPLDAGQSSNSALQDCEDLLKIVQSGGKDLTLKSMVEKYEDARDKETWALIKLMMVASPYQYNQSPLRLRWFMFNKRLRASMAKVVPWFCSPDADSLMRQSMSYREARRRNRRSTVSLLLLLASVASVSVSRALNGRSDD